MLLALPIAEGLRTARHVLIAGAGGGFDSHHGVCHAHVLENLAALQRVGAFHGACTVSGGGYLDAVVHAAREHPAHASIVHGQVAAALRGEFGNTAVGERTGTTELFVNPLMALYFVVGLDALASHLHYRAAIEHSRTPMEVSLAIEAYREGVVMRPRRAIPH